MVKTGIFVLALASALPTLTLAAKCTNGLAYCGYNLDKKGNYVGEIVAELERVGDPVDARHKWYSLFMCGVGGDGWIRYVTYCENGCRDGGSGNSDYC